MGQIRRAITVGDTMTKNPHAVALGKKGGSVTSKRKAAAARKNGKKGGWATHKKHVKAIVATLSMLTTVACAGANPAGPSNRASLQVPAELQAAMTLLDNDPWVHPLLGSTPGAYIRQHVQQIVVDDALQAQEDLGARAVLTQGTILWRAGNHRSAARQAALLLHEARHLHQNAGHSCGPQDGAGDRTVAEGGAYGVQIAYLEHVGDAAEAQWFADRYIGCR